MILICHKTVVQQKSYSQTISDVGRIFVFKLYLNCLFSSGRENTCDSLFSKKKDRNMASQWKVVRHNSHQSYRVLLVVTLRL